MKKTMLILAGAALLAAAAAMTSFAGTGGWMCNDYGYWWQRTDGSYPVSTWKWIDGNGDGVAECYHFDAAGYMDSDTWVEGYYVDADGAWSSGGVKYTVTSGIEETAGDRGAVLAAATGSASSSGSASYDDPYPVSDALSGNYEMRTEMLDAFITIDRGNDGEVYLYYWQIGHYEDGSSAEESYRFWLQDLGPGQTGSAHHYIGDECTYSGDVITFDWAPGMDRLSNVVLNGAYMSHFGRQAGYAG